MRLAATLAIGFFCFQLAGAPAPEKKPPAIAGLDAEVHASWTQVPLRAWAARVSELAGRPVILDRRIDPDRRVTLTTRGEPLRAILDRVAAEAGAAVDELESTIRLVPLALAGKARAADHDRRHRIGSAPTSARRTLDAAEPWGWLAAARPRDLLEALAREAKLEVRGIDTIPHDHFPPADFPKLSLAERFDLVLAHFDRRVLWTTSDAPTGRVVAIDAEIAPAALARSKNPVMRPKGQPTRVAKVRDEFTLELEAPLDQALAAIASQLALEIEIDRESLTARGVALGEIARADVTKVSREELFDAILQPLGLEWQLDGKKLRVYAPTNKD